MQEAMESNKMTYTYVEEESQCFPTPESNKGIIRGMSDDPEDDEMFLKRSPSCMSPFSEKNDSISLIPSDVSQDISFKNDRAYSPNLESLNDFGNALRSSLINKGYSNSVQPFNEFPQASIVPSTPSLDQVSTGTSSFLSDAPLSIYGAGVSSNDAASTERAYTSAGSTYSEPSSAVNLQKEGKTKRQHKNRKINTLKKDVGTLLKESLEGFIIEEVRKRKEVSQEKLVELFIKNRDKLRKTDGSEYSIGKPLNVVRGVIGQFITGEILKKDEDGMLSLDNKTKLLALLDERSKRILKSKKTYRKGLVPSKKSTGKEGRQRQSNMVR